MSRSVRVGPRPAPPPPPPQLAIERIVALFAALALVPGMFVPLSAFAATRNWSLTRAPATVVGGAPASVQVTATNTGDDGGGEAVGCVIIAIPASAFTVTSVVIDAVSDGDSWSASFSGDGTWWYARIVSDSGGGNRLHALESVAASITFDDTGVDGTFTWTGNAFNKEDCTDDFALARTVSVTIDGAALNNPPVAQPDAFATGRNSPVTAGAPGVLANDTDADGDPLTATQTGTPSNGALTWGGDGSFTYTPDPGFVGSDSFNYQANDGTAPSADVTVTITVTNSAPAPVDDVYSSAWSQSLVVPAPGILGNDTDADGDPLTASVVSGPANGLLLPSADGSFTYVPSALFVGTDSFVYAASDGIATTQATVFINVANAAPAASPDGPYAATEDTTLTVAAPGVLGNDSDDDGDPLTAVLVTDATNGTVTLQPDGTFDYAPDPDFAGADSFTYRASDGLDTSAVTSVSITVAGSDDPPAAAPEAYATAEDTTLSVPAPGVLTNDTDVDGDALTSIVVTPPSDGQLTLDPDGSFEYVPLPDFHGSDSFTYAVDDGTSSATATVTLTVSTVNDAPVASPDSKGTGHATSVLVDVLANDADVDGDALTISAVGIPTSGSAIIESGRVRYTPLAGFSGSATFSYTVSDGMATDTATVTVTVAPAPTPAPVPTPRATPAPSPEPSSGPASPEPPAESPTTSQPMPSPVVTSSPSPTSSPPGDEAPSASTSPATTPAPQPASPSAGGDAGALTPLAAPEMTTAFDSAGGAFEFTGGLGGFGGSFAWALPAAILGVPGLLFMLAVAGQLLGAVVWVPAIRRMLAGVGVRRRVERDAEDQSH